VLVAVLLLVDRDMDAEAGRGWQLSKGCLLRLLRASPLLPTPRALSKKQLLSPVLLLLPLLELPPPLSHPHPPPAPWFMVLVYAVCCGSGGKSPAVRASRRDPPAMNSNMRPTPNGPSKVLMAVLLAVCLLLLFCAACTRNDQNGMERGSCSSCSPSSHTTPRRRSREGWVGREAMMVVSLRHPATIVNAASAAASSFLSLPLLLTCGSLRRFRATTSTTAGARGRGKGVDAGRRRERSTVVAATSPKLPP